MNMNQEMKDRRSRYKRDRKNPRPGRFQAKGDTEIILFLHDYKYITRPLLEVLTSRKGTSLKNRLRFLFDHGYLMKVQFSRAYTEKGTTPDVYILDERGRGAYQWATHMKADPSPKRNLNKDLQLEHALLINTVRVMVTAACRQREDLELVHWERAGKETKDTVRIKGKKRTIAPDAFFVIKEVGGQAYPFFLEADRTTMAKPVFTKKLQAYYAYWRTIHDELSIQQGKKKKIVSNRFNIHGFRILTVIEHELDWQLVRNKDRLSSLIEAGYKATGGRGWKGFWFTSTAFLDLAKPESILNPIWRITYPGQEKILHSIVQKKRDHPKEE